MNNTIKRLSSTHLQVRTTRYLKKTSSSKGSRQDLSRNINIQQLSNRILQQLLKPDLPNKKPFYKKETENGIRT